VSRSLLACALLALGTGCYTVGFEPVAPVPRNPPLQYHASVTYPPATAAYTHSVRSFAAGIGNSFTIPVGQVLQEYGAAYLGPAFPAGPELGIEVAIDFFEVEGFKAQIRATFSVTRDGEPRFKQQYQAVGNSYFTRTLFGGAFAMKSSMRRTTDDALRSLFEQFLANAQSAQPPW
jgi:hypothetical protein